MNVAPDDRRLQPDPETVRDKLEDGERYPVYREYVSDTLTPVSAYLALSDGGQKKGFLLESVEKGEQIARYSFLSVNPRAEITVREDEIRTNGSINLPDNDNPLDALRDFADSWNMQTPAGLPGFTGGLVGYVGYEMIRHVEPTVPVSPPSDRVPFPDLYMYLVDRMVIFDHVKRRIFLVGHVSSGADESIDDQYGRVNRELDDWAEALSEGGESPEIVPTDRSVQERIESNFSREQYEQAVREIKEDIRDGEIFQAVLSQKFQLTDPNHPLNMYRRLRSLNPSPYMFYLDFNEFHLVGSSPEILVQKQGSTGRVRPIAGTRRRGEDPEEDDALARELKADDKERAEHTMLVDLGRNDLGRVCEAGTVEVTERAYIERYSHVMHMVSNVEGELREDMNAMDLLKATFPAGTVTGAPKVRAMQILHAREPDRRGPYAGAVGYLSFQGDLDTCIVIRTIMAHGDTITIQAGGGIVADSEPSLEFEESCNKAAALMEAIETLPDVQFL